MSLLDGGLLGQGSGLVRRGRAPTYDAASLALFARMSVQPDSARKTAINTLIVAGLASGWLAKLDELWIYAAHAEQAALLGWKDYRNCVAVNVPTFTVDRGFAGNGTTSYLNTQFVPSSDGVNYTLNDASLGVYSRTNSTGNFQDALAYSLGAYTGVMLRWMSNNSQYAYSNDTSGTVTSVANSLGLGVARRTASNAAQSYRNGSRIATATFTSTSRPTVPIFIGAGNSNGAAALFSTRQYAAAFVGGAMTEQQQADFYTHLQAYMVEVGANV